MNHRIGLGRLKITWQFMRLSIRQHQCTCPKGFQDLSSCYLEKWSIGNTSRRLREWKLQIPVWLLAAEFWVNRGITKYPRSTVRGLCSQFSAKDVLHHVLAGHAWNCGYELFIHTWYSLYSDKKWSAVAMIQRTLSATRLELNECVVQISVIRQPSRSSDVFCCVPNHASEQSN